MLWRERLWLMHKRKRDEPFCPLCFAPIKWVYDGTVWIPCDQEPALGYPGRGNKTAVYQRELRKDVRLYREGPIEGGNPVEVLIPHVLTCEILKEGKPNVKSSNPHGPSDG